MNTSHKKVFQTILDRFRAVLGYFDPETKKKGPKTTQKDFWHKFGAKRVFSGIFDPGAENWPFSRKWAF